MLIHQDFLAEVVKDFSGMDWLREKDSNKVRAWSEVSTGRVVAKTPLSTVFASREAVISCL